MKKILLACSSGMSTSILVNQMIKAAKEAGIEAEIWAVGQTAVENEMAKADVLLFGPRCVFSRTNSPAKPKNWALASTPSRRLSMAGAMAKLY